MYNQIGKLTVRFLIDHPFDPVVDETPGSTSLFLTLLKLHEVWGYMSVGMSV